MVISVPALSQEGFQMLKSNNSVTTTIEKLSDILSEKGMKIFAKIDHQKGAIASGLELRPTTLIIFGNPKVGTKLLQCDQRIGVSLPLKMLIWQDEEETVWIGYWSPLDLNNSYHLKDCQEVLNKVKNALSSFAKTAAS